MDTPPVISTFPLLPQVRSSALGIRGLLIRQGRAVTTKADNQCAHPTSVNLLPSFIKGPAARQPVSQSVRREIRGPCREAGIPCRRASMRGRLLLLNVPSCPPAAMPPSRPETPCQGQSAGVPRGRVLSLSCLSSTRVDGLRLASPRLSERLRRVSTCPTSKLTPCNTYPARGERLTGTAAWCSFGEALWRRAVRVCVRRPSWGSLARAPMTSCAI